jgi:hypothetical protein
VRSAVGGCLLSVGVDEPVDEFVEVASPGEVSGAEFVGQFGLGLAFVTLAGGLVGLAGFAPFGGAGLTDLVAFGAARLARPVPGRSGRSYVMLLPVVRLARDAAPQDGRNEVIHTPAQEWVGRRVSTPG